MAGQVWATGPEGGYLYSDELSSTLRVQVQALTKFRQFCDAEDGSEKGLKRGDKFHWDVVSDVATQGGRLSETQPIPETNFVVTQGTLTVTEAGNSVPYTGKLSALSKFEVESIIDKNLKNDCRKFHDNEAYLQFKETPLRYAPTGGTSTTSVTVTTNGATATTNNVALGTGHIKAIADDMRERNIPPFIGDDYIAMSHPTTFRPVQNELETINQYTGVGMARVYSGEKGRYEGFRFVDQNHIPKGGANDSTTYDVWTNTADAWNNAKSSWAFFFGGDTVMEGVCIPEEIRAKLPTDYGRSQGIAWLN